jgi:hypothetical protein
MSFIVTLLVRWGLKETLAKRLAPFAAIAAALALLPALWGAFQVWDWFDDRAAIEQDKLEANNAMLEEQLKAEETAAAERLRNAETNRETERAYEDAILIPKSGDDPDPAVRLACERLRRDGQDTTGVPGCGGR